MATANVVVGCGPSPASKPAEAPSGTLVIVIKQGPERVPFHPKVARIQRANQQISTILGHSLQIELDGALLPQTHDGLARVDDVKSALEKNATRWWRDTPNRRGMALFIMARQTEGLHVHYGDNHWTRFVAEYGGPIRRDVFSTYLAEGARAVEMTPKIWLALAKGSERDDLVAKSIPVLLERDRQARTSKAIATLALLRTRYCDEKNANGMTMVKSSIDRWAAEHPQEAASVSNARADFTLARCKEPPKEDRD